MTAIVDRYELASTVAHEIRDGFRAYAGSRWERVAGEEKAVCFTIHAPTLEGRSPRDFDEGAIYRAPGHSYRDGRGYTRSSRILHSVHFTLEVIEGVYTGDVSVYDASSAFDYDM